MWHRLRLKRYLFVTFHFLGGGMTAPSLTVAQRPLVVGHTYSLSELFVYNPGTDSNLRDAYVFFLNEDFSNVLNAPFVSFSGAANPEFITYYMLNHVEDEMVPLPNDGNFFSSSLTVEATAHG